MARKKIDLDKEITSEETDTLVEQKIANAEDLQLSELKDIQESINKELLKEKREKEKKKKQNPSYLFLTFFLKRLREDKLYLFSFVITIAFFAVFSVKKLEETEGYYDRKKGSTIQETLTSAPGSENTNNENQTETPITDDLDINDYIGIYSREVTLAAPLVIDSTCSITEYKVVYQIKKDKSISKYLINDCLGTIKMWNDSLKYVSSSGARYISANNINYLFSASSMKEVDGETYKLDEDITTIKESQKKKDIDISFFDNNIVLMSKTDLFLIKGTAISYQLSEKYELNPVIDQIVYKSTTKNQFNFIVFSSSDTKKCYSETEIKKDNFTDAENYKIYTIKYDSEIQNFSSVNEIISRKKSDGCDLFDEDINTLNN